jgi:hypothetical protein
LKLYLLLLVAFQPSKINLRLLMKLVAIITSTWKEVLGIDQEVADIISHYSEWLSRQEYLKCINGTINVRFIIGKNCKRVRNRHS